MKRQRPPSSPKPGHETIDTKRRAALARLGLGVATAYAAPTVLKLRSVARANNGRWDSGGWGHGEGRESWGHDGGHGRWGEDGGWGHGGWDEDDGWGHGGWDDDDGRGHGGHHGGGHGPCSNPSRRSGPGGSSGRGRGCRNWRYG